MDLKFYLYILIATTILIYFLSNILRFKIEEDVNFIIKYIDEYKVFEIPFIKIAYNEFQNSTTVRGYINNYNHLYFKSKNSTLSKAEESIFNTLKKDIELLKVSFLSTIVLDNEDYVESDLKEYISKFIAKIKKAQLLNLIKTILTISCIVLFFIVVF